MNNNKLVIDLRRLNLTNKQRQSLHNAIHKTVTKQLQKISDTTDETANADTDAVTEQTAGAASAVIMTANLQVTFYNTDPGSKFTAILNGQKQTITKTDTIRLDGVKSGDMILIQVVSLGKSTVTIDISADPMQMSFPPGRFNDQFFVN